MEEELEEFNEQQMALINADSDEVFVVCGEEMQTWPIVNVSNFMLSAAFDLIESSIAVCDVSNEEVQEPEEGGFYSSLVGGRYYNVTGIPETPVLPPETLWFGNVVANSSNFRSVGTPPPPLRQCINGNNFIDRFAPMAKPLKRDSNGKFLSPSSSLVSASSSAGSITSEKPYFLTFQRYALNEDNKPVECKMKPIIHVMITKEADFNLPYIRNEIVDVLLIQDNVYSGDTALTYEIYASDGIIIKDGEKTKEKEFWCNLRNAYVCPTAASVEAEKDRLRLFNNRFLEENINSAIQLNVGATLAFLDCVNALQSEWKCVVCDKFMVKPLLCFSCQHLIACEQCISQVDFHRCRRCAEYSSAENGYEKRLIPVLGIDEFGQNMRKNFAIIEKLREDLKRDCLL